MSNASVSFPKKWWDRTASPTEEVPSWEILPDKGVINKVVILSKRNELGILSNFAPTPFKFEGKTYASVEGAWQSMKYPESPVDKRYGEDKLPYSREEVEKMSGFEAKRAGGLASELMKKYKINYVTHKGNKMPYRVLEKGQHYEIIKQMMKEKLSQNLQVKNILKSTGQLKLLPDHHSRKKELPPAWKYNEIWMEIRENL